MRIPIQNSSRFVQLLGVRLCVLHMIGQAAVSQTISEATDFKVQLLVERIQLSPHLLQVLQTENEHCDYIYFIYCGFDIELTIFKE